MIMIINAKIIKKLNFIIKILLNFNVLITLENYYQIHFTLVLNLMIIIKLITSIMAKSVAINFNFKIILQILNYHYYY